MCCQLQAIDIVLMRMKDAEFDFSKVAAVSGTGQVLLYHVHISSLIDLLVNLYCVIGCTVFGNVGENSF